MRALAPSADYRRKSKRFQDMPLELILSEGLHRNASEPTHVRRQLTNLMTLQFSHTQEYDALPSGAAEPTRAALETAKRSLDGMAVVGVTEDMDGFARALAARWPSTFGRPGCPIPSGSSAKNPTNARAKGSAPTTLETATRAAIAASNELDTELYAHARQLAARQPR